MATFIGTLRERGTEMDTNDASDVYIFEGFCLDRFGLSRPNPAGVAESIPLGSRALSLLLLLTKRRGEILSKKEIMDVVWPETAVEESNLTVQISALRRVLDHNRAHGSCIQTIPGRGYRLVVQATPSLSALPHVLSPLANGFERLSDNEVRQNGRASGSIRVPSPVSAPRMSIVVLPFADLCNNAEQQSLADGITEDLMTDLPRIAALHVISRNTAYTYQNKQVATRQICRELSVQYLLTGSVQHAGSRVRVSVRLIDGGTDLQLWAERLTLDVGELFALQDEIAVRIARALDMALASVEAARINKEFETVDCLTLHGRAA
jgi:adenylate cyclase